VCGIAGILSEADGQASFEELRRMVAVLRHRGPDDYGLYRDKRIGMAHARLSIIDLAGGAQPMANEDGSVWVCFNGEIFNYLELSRELEAAGHQFRTRSDTEVIVHAYEQYGQRAWELFNGQFAFALWDTRLQRLWLVRDRVGILPLFYAKAGRRLVFASEAKALFASGHVRPEFSAEGLAQVFTRWAAVPPHTVFAGVSSVQPGGSVAFDRHLAETRTTYWRPSFAPDPNSSRLTLDDAADALEAKLKRAVQLRLRADVPVGAYLSGGLDSSMIAHTVRRADSSPLQTFAVRFADPAFDETREQRRMAGLLGTQHNEILCGSREIGEALPDVVWHAETPMTRTAPAPLFLLSSLVRQQGMKVVLTGEGADEFLAGYDIFKEDKVRRFWARQPESAWRPALLSKLYPDVGSAAQRQTRIWQQFFGGRLGEVNHPFYSHLIRWQNTSWGLGLLAPELRNGFDAARMEQELDLAMPTGWRAWPSLGRAQLIEVTTFLSSYLLSAQGDRVAMSHSVEVRYPFLDPELVAFCSGLPDHMRLRGLFDKVLLRRVASRHLPAEIWRRPKKPYRAPMTSPFFGEHSPEYVDEMLSPQALARLGLVACGPAERLIAKARRQAGHMSSEREEMALIGLLTLQLLGHFYFESFNQRTSDACRELDRYEPAVLEDRAAVRRGTGRSDPAAAPR